MLTMSIRSPGGSPRDFLIDPENLLENDVYSCVFLSCSLLSHGSDETFILTWKRSVIYM